ncbi:MAG: cyclase family protein [Christensenellales bacterium]
MNIDKKKMKEMAAKVSNWGRWGKNDEIGTLNHVTSENIVEAGSLIRKGKVFSLGLDLNSNGPQTGKWSRVNPIHTMIFSGTDAVCGVYDKEETGIYCADDYITMPIQCATHWDALGHVFYKDTDTNELFMYNGYDPRNVSSLRGLTLCGIEKTRDKMVGRGILLDIARFRNVDFMLPGEGITAEELDACAKAQNTEIKKGDFLLIRTGDLGRRLKEGEWGTFNSGDAPGVEFETIEWMHKKEIAAVATDTWGVEVRPNKADWCFQPWHWLCIPIAGLTMGEMFVLDELANDCAKDGCYEFFFAAPPLAITNATGSPLNPQAIK